MKKKIYFIIGYFSLLSSTLAQEIPGIVGSGLPFDEDAEGQSSTTYDESSFGEILDAVTSYVIQLVAVIAVLALMISGIMLIISGGEEERFKKAKTWFIWSLVGVLISLTAWFMIDFLNNLSIG